MISVERLRELFELREDGTLIRKMDRGRHGAGRPAGTKDRYGYLQVSVEGKTYRGHRIVFAMFHGRWPQGEVDHLNGIRDDNRPSNLREASVEQNRTNTNMRSNNSSGYRGVSLHRASGLWTAWITANKKKMHIGYFKKARDAAEAYILESLELHGEFSPFRKERA